MSAIGKLNNGGKKWLSIDIGSMALSQIFLTYRSVLALIKDPFMTDPEVFDFESIRGYSGSSLTFNQFLTQNGSDTLPTTPGSLEIKTVTGKYADAFRAGFSVTPVTQSGAVDGNEPKEDKTWLLLQKDGLDYDLFEKHCLVNINGFFHFSEVNNIGVYVKDAMLSNFHCGESTIGIVSFNGVSELTTKPITLDMIKQQATRPLNSKLILDVGEDISNKTVLLSLGGYLVLPNTRVFTRDSANTLLIDFNDYSLIDRFFESRQYLDYSSFNLDTPYSNDTQYTTEELLSDDFVKNLLTMSQSFVIILDNPDVYFEYDAIRKSPMPGTYTSFEKPYYPLVLGLGMLGIYWYTYQKPMWSIDVIDNFWYQRQYNTTDTKSLLSMDDARDPKRPIRWSRAHFLKMSADTLAS